MNEQTKDKQEDNIVRISDKPLGAYLTAITIKLENYEEVYLTAFGRNLDTAFVLAEKAKNLFNVRVDKIESFTQNDDSGVEHKGIRVVLKKI